MLETIPLHERRETWTTARTGVSEAEFDIATHAPRPVDWRDRMTARPGVRQAPQTPDRTAPGRRTGTGHAR